MILLLQHSVLISLSVFAIWYTMQEGEIFASIGKLFSHLPQKLHNPLYDCPACMAPWYGSVIYWLFFPGPIEDWALTIVASLGLNVILLKLFPDKETPGIHGELETIADRLFYIGEQLEPVDLTEGVPIDGVQINQGFSGDLFTLTPDEMKHLKSKLADEVTGLMNVKNQQEMFTDAQKDQMAIADGQPWAGTVKKAKQVLSEVQKEQMARAEMSDMLLTPKERAKKEDAMATKIANSIKQIKKK